MTPFLAQYSIRSKQAYIFRTNRLREVTGASTLIANAFDRLFAAAEKSGYRIQRAEEGTPFRMAEILQAFEVGTLQAAELYEGGGNDTILMAGEDVFRRVNQAFTHDLMTQVPGMIPLCVGIPIQPDENGKYDYRADYARLQEASAAEKSVMTSGQPKGTLPFAMIDSVTRKPFQPERPRKAAGDRRYTAESLAKQNAYISEKMDDESARQLDEMLGNDDSMLAIIHADGNNMGLKLKDRLGEQTDYDSCVDVLREFSGEIDRIYVREGNESIRQEIDRIREEQRADGKPHAADERILAVRSLISDGDDYTLICNGRWALRLAKAYLESVSRHDAHSACIGICLFHRHYPFDRAYDLAEQACEQAKKMVHREGRPDECWIDFHYLHGGVPDDLEETRTAQGTAECMFRPWRCDRTDDPRSVTRLEKLSRELIAPEEGSGHGTTRTNLKDLGAAREVSEHEAIAELERVYYRAPELRCALQKLFPDETELLKAIYDLSEVYDLWFARRI